LVAYNVLIITIAMECKMYLGQLKDDFSVIETKEARFLVIPVLKLTTRNY
jgi:hypothetical protein